MKNYFQIEYLCKFHHNYLLCSHGFGTGHCSCRERAANHWARWLFYIASCSITTLDIAFIAQKPIFKKVEVELFTALTILSGFLASMIITVYRCRFFTLSTAAYIGMLYTLFKRSGDKSVKLTSIMSFVMMTWPLFPLVWVLAPTGFGVFTAFVEAVFYLALDFVTKITFGSYISARQNIAK